MDLGYKIKYFLKQRFEWIVFWTIVVLLIVVCLWSLRIPHRNMLVMEEVLLNKTDSIDFRKDQLVKSWTTLDTNLITIKKNLDQGNQTEGEKVEKRTVDRSRSNEILDQQSTKPKIYSRLESQAIPRTNTINVNRKKLSRDTSHSVDFPIFKEKGSGYLTITLKNAYEYGYGYVFIDGMIWQKGKYNTTPLKIKLPIGKHKVELKRDGFFSSPMDTTILIEKNTEKWISFILNPK